MFLKSKMMVVLAAAALMAFGCAKNDSQGESSSLGNVSMAVVMDDSSEVTSVHWVITDSADVLVKQGDIDVSDPTATISTFIMGIPVGTDYTMTLTADIFKDGKDVGDCIQTATFNVTVGSTTSLTMTLNCTLEGTTGNVKINAEANVCPVLDSMTVNPTTQALGADITMTSLASDVDGDTIAYAWTVSIDGALPVAVASTADATYTCTDKSENVVLTLTLKDGVTAANDELPCDIKTSVTVVCESAAICGNNVKEAGEQCDDGNRVSEDGCSATCKTESCGDGIIQPNFDPDGDGFGEICDPPREGVCCSNCRLGCRNGIVDPGEICDDGNDVNCGDMCSNAGRPVSCGDGTKECDEACDDGNNVNGDGVTDFCNADCTEWVDPCTDCSITNCTTYKSKPVYADCHDDPANGTLCSDVVECAHATGCVLENAAGTPWPAADIHPNKCYCGTASPLMCLAGSANGECKAEMEAAAGTTNPEDLATRFADPAYAIGDAMNLLLCELDFCRDLCL